MSRPGSNRRHAGPRTPLAPLLALAALAGIGSSGVKAQDASPMPAPPAPTLPAPALEVVPGPINAPAANVEAPPMVLEEAPGSAVSGPVEGAPAGPALPTNIQIVRFHAPEGVVVEILGPAPEPVPIGDGKGALTVGLKVGTAYRLRLSNLPNRPEAEMFPVVDVVGHLHRPAGVDPTKYPVRVAFTYDDIEDVTDHGRLVTHVVYLEDPELALPISVPKGEIPVIPLNPSEDPLKVGTAMGRVVAIVKLGARRPLPEEMHGDSLGAYGGPWGACPFTQNDGAPCGVACGPVCGTPPPPGRPWMPKDEYLCDGGDQGSPARFGGVGGLAGIDPRDAVIRFDDGRRARVLPTNVVCIYAPRFAEVRASVGANAAVKVDASVGLKMLEKQASEAAKVGPKRLARNESVEAARGRDRASGLASRVRAGVHGDATSLVGMDNVAHIAVGVKDQPVQLARTRQKAGLMKEREKIVGIKTAESAVVTGMTSGANETLMSWTPRETVGVETPPGRPGLAVVKRVSATEAEPGDTVTFVIAYRNMGNTPIRDVSIVDSLLPRLGYVKNSAKGPRGTAFTSSENHAGGTEIKWVLPEPLKPGSSGYVAFDALVR